MRVATSDGIAEEPVGVVPGDETSVRREFFKGGAVPDHWNIVEGSVEDDTRPVVGLGAAPHAYKHQLDESGQVAEEHRPEEPEEQVSPSSRGRPRGRKSAASSSD